MDNKNLSFSGEELRNLISKRRLLLLSICLMIIAYIVIPIYIYIKQIAKPDGIIIIALALLILPCILGYKYYSAIEKIVHRIIVDNYGWEIFTGGLKYNNILDSYQFYIKDFGLLPDKGHVEFYNNLKGKTENYEFILQDVSWEVPKRTKHGTTDYPVAEYTLLTVKTPFSINCNILIKKNKILKWGIKKLKRVKIENQEFEKYYDVYSDDPGTAFTILNQDFINNLLYHKKVHKNLIELLITPENVFLHQNIKEPLINLDIFISPMALCQKKIENINSKLSILPILNLLKNQ